MPPRCQQWLGITRTGFAGLKSSQLMWQVLWYPYCQPWISYQNSISILITQSNVPQLCPLLKPWPHPVRAANRRRPRPSQKQLTHSTDGLPSHCHIHHSCAISNSTPPPTQCQENKHSERCVVGDAARSRGWAMLPLDAGQRSYLKNSKSAPVPWYQQWMSLHKRACLPAGKTENPRAANPAHLHTEQKTKQTI